MRVAFVRPDRSGEVATVPARLDVVDKGDRFSVLVDLPGVSKEDVHIDVEGARLTVSGATRTAAGDSKPEQIKVLRSERRATKYARTLHLPAEVDGDAADARLENGVLTLTLPKRVALTQITVR